MKPDAFLARCENYLQQLDNAKKLQVKVGLPMEKVGGKIYGDDISIITVGAWHEYGFGNNPVRSFLRVPFAKNQNELSAYIRAQFQKVLDGQVDADKALNFVGIKATNISKQSFRSSGDGEWPENTAYTIKNKGSSKPLIDTGTLRNSLTWLVTAS